MLPDFILSLTEDSQLKFSFVVMGILLKMDHIVVLEDLDFHQI